MLEVQQILEIGYSENRGCLACVPSIKFFFIKPMPILAEAVFFPS